MNHDTLAVSRATAAAQQAAALSPQHLLSDLFIISGEDDEQLGILASINVPPETVLRLDALSALTGRCFRSSRWSWDALQQVPAEVLLVLCSRVNDPTLYNLLGAQLSPSLTLRSFAEIRSGTSQAEDPFRDPPPRVTYLILQRDIPEDSRAEVLYVGTAEDAAREVATGAAAKLAQLSDPPSPGARIELETWLHGTALSTEVLWSQPLGHAAEVSDG